MQSTIISMEQVYLEAFALCVYLMGLEGLDWKYIYNLPWRAALFLAQIMSVFLMIHAGIGIALLALSGTSYLSLGWVGVWLALMWMNRNRIKGIIKGKRKSETEEIGGFNPIGEFIRSFKKTNSGTISWT